MLGVVSKGTITIENDAEINSLSMRKRLKAVFWGAYIFKRIIKPGNIILTGKASFSCSTPSKIEYAEHGSYLLNGANQEFFQKQFYILDNDGLSIQKCDGAFLHQFLLPAAKNFPIILNHTHICRMDNYALQLSVLSTNRFQTLYKINGPKKNNFIKTEFIRCGSEA